SVTLEMLGDAEHPFTGILDGNGYAIKNYTMSGSGQLALFHTITGTVKNLRLEGFSVLSSGMKNNYYANTASICMLNTGTIFNCSMSGSLTSTGGWDNNAYSAGVAYENGGTIANCLINIAVTAKSSGGSYAYAGGAVVYNKGTITNCFVKSSVNANALYEYAGGIAYSNSGTIEYCLFTGSVTAPSGINSISYRKGDTAVENKNYKYGTVTGGTSTTVASLNNASFYTSTLGWDSFYWDFGNLDFNSGNTATLKMTHNKVL
ncbi:MAG: hypothetical protein IJF10_00285, partial [Clostridia bacterium]|nr:hypothetical protein [Clostridia bacterium]